MNHLNQKSDDIKELAIALNKVQAVLEGAKKDSVNPFYKSKYADLESVWEAARPLLATNGLSVTQTLGYVLSGNGEMMTTLITTLLHESGQYISGEMPLLLKTPDPQGQGSAISYARRYGLAAILGIYQTDDDAEVAHNRHAPAKSNFVSVAEFEAFKTFASNLGINKEKLWDIIQAKYPSIRSANFFNTFTHNMMSEIMYIIQESQKAAPKVEAPY